MSTANRLNKMHTSTYLYIFLVGVRVSLTEDAEALGVAILFLKSGAQSHQPILERQHQLVSTLDVLQREIPKLR